MCYTHEWAIVCTCYTYKPSCLLRTHSLCSHHENAAQTVFIMNTVGIIALLSEECIRSCYTNESPCCLPTHCSMSEFKCTSFLCTCIISNLSFVYHLPPESFPVAQVKHDLVEIRFPVAIDHGQSSGLDGSPKPY